MAETATIASPALLLNVRVPDAAPKIPTKVNKAAHHPLSAAHDAPKSSQTNGVTKRKQSKSRNGCITCKNKRLKCDETKPTCQQCARRAVPCGGYKKDFKWRPFEEPNAPGQPTNKSRNSSDKTIPTSTPNNTQDTASFQNIQVHFAEPLPLPPQNIFHTQPQSHLPLQYFQPPQISFSTPLYSSRSNVSIATQSSPHFSQPPLTSPTESFTAGSLGESHGTYGTRTVWSQPSKVTAPSSVSSGQSPRLVDLLQPGTDLSVPPAEYGSFITQHEAFYQPTGLTPPGAIVDDDIEEVSREIDLDPAAWVMRLPSPTPSSSSSSSGESPDLPIFVQPQFSLTSPEHLTRRYDRDTCGVLSVKDGPTENPWRTLVWPLARDCPALYHAIASMTSFHQSKELPTMRIQGIDHMRNAVHALAAGLQNMRFDAAISTTLVLAFSESWDQHISTGINHIKGAKILINQALVQHRQEPKRGDEWIRLKFLCNTWIYMDVIARLTSGEDDENNDVDIVHESINTDDELDTKLDPLMGCAHTLFPIIGRVATLVKKVRRSDSNGPSIISQAMTLKSQLEEWTTPSFIEDPEDETTSPHDSRSTATAYQYATLLYLHQAVPEIPSQSSFKLAERVLNEIATVQPRSRSVIVHIYPLMAAGCEVTKVEDREWVKERWGLMMSRMKLGILEKCLEVTKEVWCRRDAYTAELAMMDNMQSDEFVYSKSNSKRDFDSFLGDFQANGEFCWFDQAPKRRGVDSVTGYSVPLPNPVAQDCPLKRQTSTSNNEPLEAVYTVKGRLHWLGVMKDWDWEVLLG